MAIFKTVSSDYTITCNNGLGNVNLNATLVAANITATNLTALANIYGNIATPSQTMITEVGQLVSLSVLGNVIGGNNATFTTLNTTSSAEFGSDVLINGNLNVVGNITEISISTLNIADPIITLAANNVTDAFDIGIIGQYEMLAPYPTYLQYGGLIRDHVTNEWNLFSNITSKPTTTVDFTNAIYDTLNAGNVALTGNLDVGQVVTSNLLPTTDLALVIGNASNQWREVYTGNLKASSNISATGNLLVSGYANITGNTNITSNLNVTQNAIFSSNIVVSGYSNTTGNINGSANLNLAGNAVVVGNVSATGNVNTDGITVVNDSVFGGAITANNIIAVHDITATDNLYANNLSVTSNATIGGNSVVVGNSSVGANSTVGNNLIVSGYANVTGNVNVTSNVNANNATITTDLVVGNNITSNSMVTNSLSWGNGSPIISPSGNASFLNIVATGFSNVAGVSNALSFVSTVANGTAPFVVASNTLVSNLNANLLNGLYNTSANTALTIVSRDANADFAANTITARSTTVGTLVTTGNVISTADSGITLDPLTDGGSGGTVYILGNLQVTGNVTTVNSNTVVTDSLVFQSANNAINATAASGGGLAVGPAGSSYATWFFNSVSNSWVSSLAITSSNGANINGPITNVTNLTANGNISTANLTVSATADFSTANLQVKSFGVGTAASGLLGEIRAANNITGYYSSDSRFKENIVDISNAVDIVSAIGGKTFDWTDKYITEHGGEDGYFVQKHDFGVIAQDVQAHFPQAVRTRQDGSLAVDYSKLSALAFAAISELKQEIEELKGKIK